MRFLAAVLCVGMTHATERVMVTMRDGYNLSTYINCGDLSLEEVSATGIPRKVVFDTSTYGHDGSENLAIAFSDALGAGFCAVRQDLRGSGLSVGQDFSLWRTSGNDSFDTFKWIAEQPWSDGEVYQTGISADGLASYCSILDRPPQLKKQYVVWASIDSYSFSYPGGAFRKGLQDGWLKSTFPHQYHSLIDTMRHHEAPGEWWNPVNATGRCSFATEEAVLLAGWYDIFLNGNLEAFPCYNSDKPRAHMVVEPCGHCLIGGCPIYIDQDGNSTIAYLMALDLFAGLPFPQEIKQLTFYVLGAGTESGLTPDPQAPGNYWTTMPNFPEPAYTKYYFHADGSLAPDTPTPASMSFTYRPEDPVPTHGGNNLMLRCGALDQQHVESRSDVLRYTSEVLQEDVAITGAIKATLFVSSNCTDTDFTAKLTDVHPSGKSVLINDGIIRMRWRGGVSGGVAPQMMTPGQVYEVEVSLWATSYIFPKGHKIRVSVSSSNSPRFEANPNNGLPLTETGPLITAHNTVFLGGEHASYFTFPIVQKSQLPPVDLHRITEEWLAARPASYRKAIDLFKKHKAAKPSWMENLDLEL